MYVHENKNSFSEMISRMILQKVFHPIVGIGSEKHQSKFVVVFFWCNSTKVKKCRRSIWIVPKKTFNLATLETFPINLVQKKNNGPSEMIPTHCGNRVRKTSIEICRLFFLV